MNTTTPARATTIDWTESMDQRLIDYAYMGLISEGIAEQMQLSMGQVHGRIKFFGLSLDKIRQLKREGKSKKDIMAIVEEARAMRTAEPAIPEPKSVAFLMRKIIQGQADLLDVYARLEKKLYELENLDPQLKLIGTDEEDQRHAAG